MATTPNFNWSTPDNTGLVKNGALDIRTLGNAIDASMADLKGGTTGQVLAKASNTDMDFVWAADAGAPESLGFSAGKNKIINGAFDVWQRGTSFSNVNSGTYVADRFFISRYGATTNTISRQTFTPGAAPVVGYEGSYFLRVAATSVASNESIGVCQKIENVQTFAGQTATISFWAKAEASRTVRVYWVQNFGTGGSAVAYGSTLVSITTSWTRYTVTFSIPSISGKTVGTGSSFEIDISLDPSYATGNPVLDLWGVQVEAGSVATAFQTATGTLQGELAACQRYYQRFVAESSFGNIGQGFASSTTVAYLQVPLKTTMRVAPTVFDRSGTQVADYNAGYTTGTFAIYTNGTNSNIATISYTHGSAALTQYRPYTLSGNGTTDYVGFGAEL